MGNKTLAGGLLGGLAGVEITKKVLGEHQNTGDLFTAPLLLGMIIGRIGCFTAGVYEQVYGLPSRLPWAMDLGDGIRRHPVVLYEIAFLLLLWLAIEGLKRYYVLQQGAQFKILMIAYLTFRLLLDFIKPGWRYLAGLGTIQLSCIAGLLYYVRYLANPGLLIISKRNNAC
jgi:prolipoprotein diacylglyceryltransferase